VLAHKGIAQLKLFLSLAIIGTINGIPVHIHAEGPRGVGKTSTMRAIQPYLPTIKRIKGCLYNCDPTNPHCPEHRNLSISELATIGAEMIQMPLLELSANSKIGTALGSIDLRRITDTKHPQAYLLPGIIPQAHRGIIIVDEINRLAENSPQITDLLLQVMGTKPGIVQIEEPGFPVQSLPVQVSVWAASNPDEEPGPLHEIRRQLADRFDFTVMAKGLREKEEYKLFFRQQLQDQVKVATDFAKYKTDLNREYILKAELAGEFTDRIAQLLSTYKVESIRAINAIILGLKLSAIQRGNKEPDAFDLDRIMQAALCHRLGVEAEELARQAKIDLNGSVSISKARSTPYAHQAALEPVVSVAGSRNSSIWQRLFFSKEYVSLKKK
jgi:magnesium chelatase subunit I